jgi:Holliday junction resolvasome RuvABC endonuclease subunit
MNREDYLTFTQPDHYSACRDSYYQPREEPPAAQGPWVLRVMGVDPGFASCGVVVLEQREGQVKALLGTVLRTKKADKKVLRDLRVSADDQRRMRTFWAGLQSAAVAGLPQALAVETYAPQPGRNGGNAWKAAMVYGMVQGFGLANGLQVLPFLPSDLKRAFANRASASKQAVADVVLEQVPGLKAFLKGLPEGQHEHLTDAAGHALLGLREMAEMRRMMGLAVP